MRVFSRLRTWLRNTFRSKDGAARTPLHLAQRQVLAVRGSRVIPSAAQLRELPRYLSRTERRIFRLALGGILLAGLLLGYRFLMGHTTTVPAVGGAYTEGLVGTPQYLNPLYAVASDTDIDLTRLLFSGLLRINPGEGLVPDLATGYTVSDDQKNYIFTLRTDATWHDGAPVTADDIIFTIHAIQNPDYRSPLAVSFGGVAVEALDDHTVSFTLAEPFAPFLSTLTTGILPAHLWENIPPASAQLALINRQPIGSGPYMLKKTTLDQRGIVRGIVLSRNPDFYRGAANIDTLTFNFYANNGELTDAIKNKNVEGAGFIPIDIARDLADDRGIQLLTPALPQFTAVFFNQSHSSILADDAVRTALNQATDRTAIAATVLGGHVTPITSPVLPGMPGYDAAIGAVTLGTAAAASALDAAGWKLVDGATVRAKGTTALSFTLTTVDTPELSLVAEAIKSQWMAIGADVTITRVDANTLKDETLRNRSYDALLTGELYGADPDAYPFWHSSQVAYPGLNLSEFSNRKADEAIETARTSTDQAKRGDALHALATLIAEETPAVFLYQPTYIYMTAAKIHNIVLPSVTAPADRFSGITEWYIKTRRVFSWQGEKTAETSSPGTTQTDPSTPDATETPPATVDETE